MKSKEQEKLLDALKFYHEICCENNLRYYIIGGTFLGAIRHGGFIPWDDDIDVGMPRTDYRKFQKIMEHPIGNYILETPQSKARDYIYNISKLYDIRTTAVELNKFKTKRGIYLDVLPLDGIGNTRKEVRKNFAPIYWLNMFTATRTSVPRKGRKWYKNIAIYLSGLIPERAVNTKKLIVRLDNMCEQLDFDECKYGGVLLGGYGKKDILRRELFGDPKEYRFEDIMVYGPEKADEYLTHIYSEWRKYPPIEKRNSGHDFIYIDLNHSYLENRK
ncbi:MAG: LicD family protein [Hungatella sp.]|nr:LicD family protein [Hungatella sp.]